MSRSSIEEKLLRWLNHFFHHQFFCPVCQICCLLYKCHLKRYEKIDFLGEGQFATVYKVTLFDFLFSF